MNLANRPVEYRQAVEADKTACFIRHRCGSLEGWQRQVCAQKILDGHPEDQRERIRAAMKARAKK